MILIVTLRLHLLLFTIHDIQNSGRELILRYVALRLHEVNMVSESEMHPLTQRSYLRRIFPKSLFLKVRISCVISCKKSSFPGDDEGANFRNNFEKKIKSQGMIFVMLSCRKVIISGHAVISDQERKRKRHMNLRKSSEHRPGAAGTPGRTNMGSTGWCPGGVSFFFAMGKLTEKLRAGKKQ